MKINEQVLSRKQMAHLRELGIDTSDASLCWRWSNEGGGWVLGFMNPLLQEISNPPHREGPFPAYTIGDLIEKLPKYIDGSCLLIEFCASDLGYGDWDCGELYGINAQQKFNDKSLKEALYDLLCWVAENHKELLEVKND